ncbi:MAG TPA: hypothetical protein VKY31_01140 [Terriglobia bacterium]|nr:hypothetical protein [Terriglobia bacterium]
MAKSAANPKLTGAAYNPSIARQVPAGSIFVTEFATSSSIDTIGGSLQRGNNILSYGDSDAPTLTPAGQATWLQNTLCAFQGAGINKLAYWASYDPYTLWTSQEWGKYGDDLAWNGYWGLSYENSSDGNKAAWTTLTNLYNYTSLSCPAGTPRTPAAYLQTETDLYGYPAKYTIGQPIGLRWSATETTSISISGVSGSSTSYGCTSDFTATLVTVNASALAGSCSLVFAPYQTSTGTYTYTLTASNNQGSGAPATTTASASAEIDLNPSVNAGGIVNASTGSSTIYASDTISIYGEKFSRNQTSSLQWIRPGYSDVWMSYGDGHYYWNGSYFRINVSLDSRLASGTWQVKVWNGYSGYSSDPYTVTIN